jgi:hypothetical protein
VKKGYMDTLSTKKIIKDHSLLGHEDIRHQIRILPELKALIPPLLPDELEQLENNIRKDGCREALLVWETRQGVLTNSDDNTPVYILVDGHNRYGICQQYNLDFRVSLKPFSDLDEVRTFMIENQLGRRNLTPEQTAYLRGLRYRDEKGERGKYNRTNHKGQNVPYDLDVFTEASEIDSKRTKTTGGVSTAQKLAKQFNVNEKTIKRDAEFAAGVEKLAPDLKAAVLSGKVPVNKTLLQQIGKSNVVNGSITSLDEIPTLSTPTLSPKKNTTPKNTIPRQRSGAATTVPSETLRHKLRQLLDQVSLTTVESVSIYDEIIFCASQLRAALLEQQ